MTRVPASGIPSRPLVDSKCRRVGQGVAAAPNPELAGERHEGEDRRHRASPVAVALEAPADAHERGARRGIVLGEAEERVLGDAGYCGRAREGPRLRRRERRLAVRAVIADEALRHPSRPREVPDHRERHHHVRPRVDGQPLVHVGRAAGPPGVEEHDARAPPPGFLQVGDEVDVGVPRVGPPDEDEASVDVVRERHTREVSGHGLHHRPGGGGAHGAQQPRRAEPREEPRVHGPVADETVAAAVRVGKDGLAAPAVGHVPEALRDRRDRLVPADAGEATRPLRSRAPHRVEEPVLSVHTLGEPTDLGADEALRLRVLVRALESRHASVLDRHLQAAAIGTVEGARGGMHDGGARALGGFHPGQARDERITGFGPFLARRTETPRHPFYASRRAHGFVFSPATKSAKRAGA